MVRSKHLSAALGGGLILSALIACQACAQAQKPAAVPAEAAAPATIGVATQEPDGTIVLTLRAEGGAGEVGDAQFRYAPDNPQYAMIKAHVGPIPPGKSVPVRPFPEGK